MIPKDTIENILSASRIEEVVGDFVVLKKRGSNLIGLCPFHNEKTPSFNVSPARGIFKCFGCGKAGNSVNFLMEHEHFTYPEALRFLAKRYNIEIEEEEQSPEQIKEQNEKESLFQLNAFAQKYFTENLFEKEEGRAVGLTYLKERGFREDTIKKFQLGYCLDSWNDFSRHATSSGYNPEYLVKTGLSVQKEDHLNDRFHARVIFPIHSASGRIIGFGGRILSGDKQMAKYVNSPESEIYNKSKSLYGIFFAKNTIISKDTCYLVEGYTDVISLHQAGITNVVASSGTSLTHDQVRLIQRYTSNITILYDGDPAGIKASMRGIDMIVEQGMNVKIVLFPDGEDPDSFVRKNRITEVESFITRNAVNFILFKTRLLLGEAAGDPIKKAALIKEIVNTIALIPDGISRSLYLKECAGILMVPEQTLVNEVNKIIRRHYFEKFKESGGTEEEYSVISTETPVQIDFDSNTTERLEFELLRLLILNGNSSLKFKTLSDDNEEIEITIKTTKYVIEDLRSDGLLFENVIYQKILTELEFGISSELIFELSYFVNHIDNEISKCVIGMIVKPYSIAKWKNNKQHVEVIPEDYYLQDLVIDNLHGFKAKKIEKLIQENQKKLKNLQLTASKEEINAILNQQIFYQEIRRKIQADKLGRVIIK
jgi:DNA primase